MIRWVVVALTTLLVAATLLPLSRHEAWWVRGWDFPRLQLAILALLLALAPPLLLDPDDPLTWALMAAALGCLIYHLWWILPYTRVFPVEVAPADPRSPGDGLCVVCVNVLTPNREAVGLLRTLRAERPDLIIAVETDEWWQRQLDTLKAEYPHTLKCPLDNLYGMILLCRFPLEDARIQFLIEQDIPSMHAAVVLPSGRRIRLHALHPKPPSPTENPESGERDAELVVVGRSVAESELPVIVAGDLNDVAWSRTTRLFRKISGLLDPRVGRGMCNSYHARHPIIRWPLDHLFHSRDFTLLRIARLDRFGSDHFPILVHLSLSGGNEPDAGLEPDAQDLREAGEKTREEDVAPEDVHRPAESA